MITKPTVFVLGAGASMPYGFPSGSQLVKEIIGATEGFVDIDQDPDFSIEEESLREVNQRQEEYIQRIETAQILKSKFNSSELQQFGKALHYSQRYSIDAFLEKRPEYIEIGKWAIASLILRKEISANLFSFKNQNNGCYRYLFDKLAADWASLKENKVSFITFNYDRSLEHFLFTTTQNTYSKSNEACANALENIPIIHVHGALGKLPWQIKDGLAYGADFEESGKSVDKLNAVDRASQQIKVMTENQSSSEEFGIALNLLSSAERIYFLGFSYHSMNLRRLRINDLFRHANASTGFDYNPPLEELVGSAKGLEESERNSVYKNWAINLPDSNSDSLLFLRRYAKLD